MMVRAYSLRELESASGKPRTTISYYTSQGLLPQPQRTPAGRLLYSEEHLSLLKEISHLKSAGLSLHQIKTELGHVVRLADQAVIDLATHQRAQMHNHILAVAYDQFATLGYAKTHISTIIQRVGTTVTVFYDHFPSKRALLAECVAALVDWSEEFVESQRALIHDPVEEMMWYFFAQLPVFQLGAAARAILVVDNPTASEGGLRRTMEACHASVIKSIQKVLTAWTAEERSPCRIADELIAENIYGAADLLFRSPNEKHTQKELIRSHVWLVLAASAQRNGGMDVDAELERLESLIDYFATHMPPRPPVLQLASSGDESTPGPAPFADRTPEEVYLQEECCRIDNESGKNWTTSEPLSG